MAVKVIRASEITGADRERFLFEARSAAGLEHPNIVRVYDVEMVGDQPYFSMELAVGSLVGALGKLLGKPVEIAELLRTLARAMDFAHRRGIIHRDLKPGNILLAADGTPKVADFGLAKRLAAPRKPRGEAASSITTACPRPAATGPMGIDSAGRFSAPMKRRRLATGRWDH